MKIILAFAALALLLSCNNQQKDNYMVSGTIDKSLDGKTIYVSHLTANNASEKIDSTTIKNGAFKVDLPETDKQYLGFVTIEGLRTNLPYIAENHPIEMTIYKDSIRASAIKGGTQNKVFKRYIDNIFQTNRLMTEDSKEARTAMTSGDTATINRLKQNREELIENDKLFKIKLAKENPESLVAVMALTDLMRLKVVPANEMRDLFDSLSEEVKTSGLGKALNTSISSKSATEIGVKAPSFSAPTPSGENLALADALGKVTILDFWAAWCKPCRIENPNVVKVYNKYHDKGLNILSISLDKKKQKDKWLKAIEDDQLAWQHVSNLEFWEDPVAKMYNVRAIPATFILDEDGIIIAKNLRGDDLEKKMSELLN